MIRNVYGINLPQVENTGFDEPSGDSKTPTERRHYKKLELKSSIDTENIKNKELKKKNVKKLDLNPVINDDLLNIKDEEHLRSLSKGKSDLLKINEESIHGDKSQLDQWSISRNSMRATNNFKTTNNIFKEEKRLDLRAKSKFLPPVDLDSINNKPQTIKQLQSKISQKREALSSLNYMKGTKSQPNFVIINTRTMA